MNMNPRDEDVLGNVVPSPGNNELLRLRDENASLRESLERAVHDIRHLQRENAIFEELCSVYRAMLRGSVPATMQQSVAGSGNCRTPTR